MKTRQRPTIVFVTNIWKRKELTRYVLNVYKRYQEALADKVNLHLVAVGSEGKASHQLCESCGFDYVEFNNEPLTEKRNAGLRAARAYDPDTVIMAGSDDVLSPNYFEVMHDAVQRYRAIGMRDLYYYHVHKKTLGYWAGYRGTRLEEPIGAGRAYSRIFLEEVNWTLWPAATPANRGLDRICFGHLRSQGLNLMAMTMQDLGVWGVDIKSGLNITPWQPELYDPLWTNNQAREHMEQIGMEPIMDWHLAIGPYLKSTFKEKTGHCYQYLRHFKNPWLGRLKQIARSRFVRPLRYLRTHNLIK